MTPIVSLQNVSKSFFNHGIAHEVLKSISLEVMSGEVICLVGPSGSGKSTTLRIINGLETIQSGQVVVNGMNYRDYLKKPHEVRRQTAMIFQRFELFPHLNALENVALAQIHVLGRKRNEAVERASDLLCKVGLKDHQNKLPSAISGGQQQRVAIARALAMEPRVLLCDEPTSALDPELVFEVLDLLTEIANRGMTMVIVTHELSFAERVSKRCFFLDHGEIVETASTHDFFHAPKSKRLVDFIARVKR